MTPIVLAVPNERLVVRLTNHSRDGIRDEVHANDSLVISSGSLFRINQKGGVHTDTLTLNWTSPLPEGSHLLPLKIGEDVVAQYVARSFPVFVDSTKRIGMVSGVPSSPTLDAIRRLGLTARVLTPDDRLHDQLAALDVVVIDRRALSFQNNTESFRTAVHRFAEAGGHVVVLAQDDQVWNAQPLFSGMTLGRSLALSVQSGFVLDSLHSSLQYPNDLTKEDWSDWLYRLGYNTIRLGQTEGVEILIKERRTSSPLVVAKQSGKGRYTYIDLDIQHQWMNIHAGALRLLANVLAR